MDRTYINKLEKDIARVEKFIEQADNAIGSLEAEEFNVPLDRKIVALYSSYSKVPYTPEKSDTIMTAATNIILQNMKDEFKEEKVNKENFDDIIELLEQDQKEKQELINKFDFNFVPEDKATEAEEMEQELLEYAEIIVSKFIEFSNQQDCLSDAMTFIRDLFEQDWVTPPKNLKFLTNIFIRNDILNSQDDQVKLLMK